MFIAPFEIKLPDKLLSILNVVLSRLNSPVSTVKISRLKSVKRELIKPTFILIFSMLITAARLERNPTVKDQVRDLNIQNITYGHLGYPVLQTSDILLYKGDAVPVGEDQKQHLELTRDIAQAFNSFYEKDVFPLPEPQIFGSATRVMSLRDGSAKMSKSDPSDYARINLTDDADMIAQKIRKAKTDADALPSEKAGLAGRPEAENLVGIYAALADLEIEDVLKEFSGRGFAEFKPALADLAVARLSPMGQKMRELMENPAEIDAILADGAARAAAIARPLMAEVRDIVGFLGSSTDH